MASATASTRTEEGGWSWPLRARVLAVNLFAVIMFAGGVLYLDSYRGRLIDQRRAELATEAKLLAQASGRLLAADATQRQVLSLWSDVARARRQRVVHVGPMGAIGYDSLRAIGQTVELRSPAQEPTRRQVARALDRAIEWITDANRPPPLPADVRRTIAFSGHEPTEGDAVWLASDGSLIVTAAAEVPGPGLLAGPSIGVVHLTASARDITFRVRDERLRAFRLFLFVAALTLALSWFLARTIAKPLRQLADAAEQVREGRAREVVVPRLPERRDEIGQLARALSDMTAALRRRIDATEAFAADVAHELKNPLASLRSALETSERIEDRETRAELRAVMADDVARMDRLLSAIADASRLDAEMSRARFVPVDLAAIARDVARHAANGSGVRIEPPQAAPPARGDPDRLGQVVRNLVENAVGFSAPGGTVSVRVEKDGARWLTLAVEDQGPGIPPDVLERIFDRFYSARPDGDGRHSGLGLAIARAIVEAHGGRIWAENRPQGGARLTARLPRA